MKHSEEICYYCDAFGVINCPLSSKFPLPKINKDGVVLPSESRILTMSIKNLKIRGKKANLIIIDDLIESVKKSEEKYLPESSKYLRRLRMNLELGEFEFEREFINPDEE